MQVMLRSVTFHLPISGFGMGVGLGVGVGVGLGVGVGVGVGLVVGVGVGLVVGDGVVVGEVGPSVVFGVSGCGGSDTGLLSAPVY
jgi:hypothetical protein